MPLDDAARGYEIFNDKEEDCRKVVLTPCLRPPVPALADTVPTTIAARPASI